MKKNIKTIKIISIQFVLFIVLQSCTNLNQKQINKESFIGVWATINPDTVYNEIVFNDSMVTFYSYDDMGFGPFEYYIESDSLQFFNLSFGYKNRNSCQVDLITKSGDTMLLERIGLISNYEFELRSFYLRRCEYLVKKNIISPDSAYKSLKKFEPIKLEENEKVDIIIN